MRLRKKGQNGILKFRINAMNLRSPVTSFKHTRISTVVSALTVDPLRESNTGEGSKAVMSRKEECSRYSGDGVGIGSTGRRRLCR